MTVALIRGHSLAVAGFGLLIGLALVAVWRLPGGRREQGAEVIPAAEEGSLAQAYSWQFEVAANRSRSDAIAALQRGGLHLETDDEDEACFEGGSQVRTRLLGGYFVVPAHLPITVILTRSSSAEGAFAVEVRDRLGRVALRDRAFESRYELRVREIQDMLGDSGGGPS